MSRSRTTRHIELVPRGDAEQAKFAARFAMEEAKEDLHDYEDERLMREQFEAREANRRVAEREKDEQILAAIDMLEIDGLRNGQDVPEIDLCEYMFIRARWPSGL